MYHVISRLTGITVGSLALGFLASFFAARDIGYKQAADRSRPLPNGSIHCNPGPWGELTYTPFTISTPDDLLPIRSIEAEGTHWLFSGYSTDQIVALLQSTSLSPDQQRAFLSPAVMHVRADGVDLTPSNDLVLSMPDDARNKLISVLAQGPDSEGQFAVIDKNVVDQQFAANGVSDATTKLFKRLSYVRGDFMVVSSLPALLSRLPTYAEKVALARGLTSQRTMLLRLHVTPQSDIDALSAYWGKGCGDTDIHTILKSLTASPSGTWMNILMVMPSLPSSEIYNFQTVQDNPLNGPPVNRDCAWTALNFFNSVPNPNFGKFPYVLRELQDNYEKVCDAPRYGDVIFFSKPNGSVIHSAVYIADNICFTKNGGNVANPWMLSTIGEVSRHYSYQIDPSQHLTVSYYRDKRIPEQEYLTER